MRLKISGPVRRQLGRDASALDAGIGLPADAQCWACGDAINLYAARPGTVTLSAVVVVGAVHITAFGHAEHTTSRLFTPAEFQAAATDKPSPVTGGHEELLIGGRPADEAVRIVDEQREQRRARLLDLAADVEQAGSDQEALAVMREATGLSMTDPDADRAELERRARIARQARPLLLTLRCPVCGQLPDLVMHPEQAFCGNDGCEVLQWDPTLDAAEQYANGTSIGSLVGEGGIPAETAEAAAACRPRQVAGSGEDDAREAATRELFHRWGYRCADGRCPVCGPAPRVNEA